MLPPHRPSCLPLPSSSPSPHRPPPLIVPLPPSREVREYSRLSSQEEETSGGLDRGEPIPRRAARLGRGNRSRVVHDVDLDGEMQQEPDISQHGGAAGMEGH